MTVRRLRQFLAAVQRGLPLGDVLILAFNIVLVSAVLIWTCYGIVSAVLYWISR